MQFTSLNGVYLSINHCNSLHKANNQKPITNPFKINGGNVSADSLYMDPNLLLIVSLLLFAILLICLTIFLIRYIVKTKPDTVTIQALKANNDLLISRMITEVSIINNNDLIPKEKKETRKKEIKIPSRIVSRLKKQLDQFEKKEDYLNPEIKLTNLSERFDTNTKYLARIILNEKGKNFKAYIRDLKIAYAKEKIDSNRKFRRYKIEVIAVECGFKTAESFSKAFNNMYDIYPSKYIRDIENGKG
ncbi:MAG: helix-turn-helix domain-containing protein [Patiriisocius sp.]|uniref:helix-turn-helix domain-containing protein n=1 Tax=Patiriisocius sp. TaxID=2822396 RepID=UPI003EF5F295